MKKISFYFCCIAVFGLFFVSCSKDENVKVQTEIAKDKAVLSFGTLLNDLANKNGNLKQAISDIPECSDSAPAFVDVIISQGGVNVVGDTDSPLRVAVNPTPADYDGDGIDNYFTNEAPELELEPGTYTLEYFTVLDDMGNVIWVAPRSGESGDSFADFVDNPLPFDINLGAGVKKYVDVDVLCYDQRMVNLYGYLFFDIETNRTNTFCIFGNYCDQNGRHFPAHFSVDVWRYSGDAENPKGAVLYEGEMNTVGTNNDGDSYADPLCLALPDNGEFYVEISLLNSDAYTTTEGVIRSGVISSADIISLYDGDANTNYYHFREGSCDMGDTPPLFEEGGGGNPGECNPNDPTADCDGDGVTNSDDACPNTPPGIEVQENGCESVQVPGRDVVVFNDINVFDNIALADPDNVRLMQNLVNFTTEGSRNSGDVVWMDRGRNARCFGDGSCSNSEFGIMRSTIEGEGFSITDVSSTSGSITNIPSDVKTIFLVMPAVEYTLEEINTFKNFAKDGGRIVFIGEWDGYYQNIPVENQFLLNMGAVLTNTGGAVDCGGHFSLPNASNRSHPIMDGIVDLTYGCASVIEPGAQDFPLFYDAANENVLAGVAKIDVGIISEMKRVNNQGLANKPSKKNLSANSTGSN